jgi:Lectin C-type domain
VEPGASNDEDDDDSERPRADAGALADATPGQEIPPDARVPSPGIDAAVDPGCPLNYARLGQAGNVYRLGNDQSKWVEAELDCEDDGAGTHLAVIENNAELQLVSSLLGVGDGWIGVFEAGDTFVTVLGGNATFLPFLAGEPDENGPSACVTLVGNQHGFADDKCVKKHRYVCECDGNEAQ